MGMLASNNRITNGWNGDWNDISTNWSSSVLFMEIRHALHIGDHPYQRTEDPIFIKEWEREKDWDPERWVNITSLKRAAKEQPHWFTTSFHSPKLSSRQYIYIYIYRVLNSNLPVHFSPRSVFSTMMKKPISRYKWTAKMLSILSKH